VRNISRDDGFTLPELLVSTTIMLIVLGGAMSTLKTAMNVNDTATQMADSNQNLRAGANTLVRDLMQAGRRLPTTGIPIANGAGATAINRPCPPASVPAPTVACGTFDNVTGTALSAITTGGFMGPWVDGSQTDVVTMLMWDPVMPDLILYDATSAGNPAGVGLLANNGTSLDVGASIWLTGDIPNGIEPVKAGELIWFMGGGGAIKTVTSVDATHVFFAAGDWFNFNQTAALGTIMQLPRTGAPAKFVGGTSAARLRMLTYYVDSMTTPGTPRLTRINNHFLPPTALAGVVEDLDISYDLVDGVVNPTMQKALPVTLAGLTYLPSQIRKVNMHIGVRSDKLSTQANGTDYIRNHVSTTISIRDLAFVDRYK
jgi:prepilin-type N-terminal cleavage/methylation domain-containing protein